MLEAAIVVAQADEEGVLLLEEVVEARVFGPQVIDHSPLLVEFDAHLRFVHVSQPPQVSTGSASLNGFFKNTPQITVTHLLGCSLLLHAKFLLCLRILLLAALGVTANVGPLFGRRHGPFDTIEV